MCFGILFAIMSWPGAKVMVIGGAFAKLVGAIVVVAWLVATVWSLSRGRINSAKLGRLRGIDGLFALVMSSLYLIFYQLYESGILWNISMLPGAGGFTLSSPTFSNTHYFWFALASYVLLTYKAAVALESAESKTAPKSGKRWKNWLMFLLQPIGLWKLQPRIRAALLLQPGVALEDHLIT